MDIDLSRENAIILLELAVEKNSEIKLDQSQKEVCRLIEVLFYIASCWFL